MKKLANLLAMAVLVSANVLTPLSYVNAEETAEVWESEVVVVQDDNYADGDSTQDVESDEVLPDFQPEILEEPQVEVVETEEPEVQPEAQQEESADLEEDPEAPIADSDESLIPMVVDSIQKANEESYFLQQEGELLQLSNNLEIQAINPNITVSYENNVVTYVDSE